MKNRLFAAIFLIVFYGCFLGRAGAQVSEKHADIINQALFGIIEDIAKIQNSYAELKDWDVKKLENNVLASQFLSNPPGFSYEFNYEPAKNRSSQPQAGEHGCLIAVWVEDQAGPRESQGKMDIEGKVYEFHFAYADTRGADSSLRDKINSIVKTHLGNRDK